MCVDAPRQNVTILDSYKSNIKQTHTVLMNTTCNERNSFIIITFLLLFKVLDIYLSVKDISVKITAAKA